MQKEVIKEIMTGLVSITILIGGFVMMARGIDHLVSVLMFAVAGSYYGYRIIKHFNNRR